jgi:hypothetical protein
MERSEEVDSQALLNGAGIAQIVVESDAGIVDEDVEAVDLADRPPPNVTTATEFRLPFVT